MLRIIATFAALNRFLQTWSYNLITFDRLLQTIGPVVCLLLLAVALAENYAMLWFAFICVSIVVAFSIVAAWFSNTIFRSCIPEEIVPSEQFEAHPTELLFSGRMTLWEGDKTRLVRFMDRLMSGRGATQTVYRVPAAFIVDSATKNLFSFISDLDLSLRILGVAVEAKKGMWTCAGRLDSMENLEQGSLLQFRNDEPALRMTFLTGSSRRIRVILSHPDENAVTQFCSHVNWLKASMAG